VALASGGTAAAGGGTAGTTADISVANTAVILYSRGKTLKLWRDRSVAQCDSTIVL
jgi:hypothetical protein